MGIELKAIGDLKGYSFVIPYLQRGYKWTEPNINVLLEDLKQFISENNEKKMYCLQPVAVVKKGDKYSIIDGQQRLTTLYLIYKYLIAENHPLTEATELFHYEYERDNNNERKNFLRDVIEKNDKNIDFFFMSQAYHKIKEWFEGNEELKNDFKKLCEAPKNEKSIQVIWYPVETEKEHEIFRNINSGKIQLTNCDLIKALLLKRNNGIKNPEQIAAQFQEMEQQFAEDRFWYMLKKTDVDPFKGQSRMDVLFNLICDIKQEDYRNEPRSAFFELSKDTDVLSKWKQARDKFQRIKDLFDDPYSFHYIGFLVYCGDEFSAIFKKHEGKNKKDFIGELKKDIKGHFEKHKTKTLKEYSYLDTKEALRRVLIMHNIETILQRYKNLHDKLELRFTYEYFPFELLYKQDWDIEHIASQTDKKLKTNDERKEWLEAISADFPKNYNNHRCDELKEKLSNENNNNDETTEEFDTLFDDLVKEIEGDELLEEKKHGIGNLVMLDRSTNRSFKNSLFPQKRRIVLIASGLRSEQEQYKETKSAYVPICTQQVYTKSYNKDSDVKLNCWGNKDYDAYLQDIQEKLSDYFSVDEENS